MSMYVKVLMINDMKYIIISVFAILYLFPSCTDMNDLHNVYLENGERIYVGKLDSAYIFPGKERVKLRYWSSDPRSQKMIIYWQNRSDSLLVDITTKNAGDSSELIIADLPEFYHIFEIVSMTAELSNKSIPYSVSGSVYAEKYEGTLTNRGVKDLYLDTVSNNWTIDWLGKVENGIGAEIVYTDLNGNPRELYAPMSEDAVVVEELKSDLKYRTLYLPEPDAIDTFYTDFSEILIP